MLTVKQLKDWLNGLPDDSRVEAEVPYNIKFKYVDLKLYFQDPETGEDVVSSISLE